MPKANWKKLKILKLANLLCQETDEQHPLTTSQICSRLNEMDIPCDRRTLSEDIKLLNDNGIEVLWTWVGKEKGYFVEDRVFSVPELKILIDAVQAASFITEKKTSEMVCKIAGLAGVNRAEELKRNMVHFNTRKHSNEHIYYNVDSIEDALREEKKIIFRYFDLDMNGGKVFRRDGHHYVVDPVALVYKDDNYYVVAYSEKHDDMVNYRVDRMEGVEVIEEHVSESALAYKDQVSDYTEQTIKMFGGKLETVELEFDNTLIGVVFDQFGENVHMVPAGDDRVVATVKVQLSPTFWGWMFQFGRKMRILSPMELLEQYKLLAQEAVSS